MASKVPKFGAWEGGENYTVYFDNARKTKGNGPMINPNDPEENPNMFPQVEASSQAPPTKKGAKSQGQQSKVPAFGAWEGEGQVAYTAYFDKVRKPKNGANETEETSDMPQLNRDVTPKNEPPVQEARSKVPQFGGWNGEENEPATYTAYFENARKTRGEPVEPQLNRDVGERAKPPSAGTKVKSEEYMDQGGVRSKSDQRNSKEELRNASKGSTGSERQGRQTPGGQSPLHPRGKPQSKSGGRGSQTPESSAPIPQFGVWNKDPAQAEGYTGAFIRSREDRMTPIGQHTPAPGGSQYPNPEPKNGCCCPWF